MKHKHHGLWILVYAKSMRKGVNMKTQFNGKFSELSFEEKVVHLVNVGEKALGLWGYSKNTKMKMLNYTENATFLLECENKPKIIMRVHRLDYATVDNIRTELQWIMDLKRDTNIRLASPLLSIDGNYIETIETPEFNEKRHVVCFEYLEGTAPVDNSDSNEGVSHLISKIDKIPDSITIPLFKKAAVLYHELGKISKTSPMTKEDRRLYQQVGKIAGKLHVHSSYWKQPCFYQRIEWDFEGTFGEDWNNFYGESYRSPKWLSKKEIENLDECVMLIKKRLEAYGKEANRYGMIHSDLRTANLLSKGDDMAVLDFDDCGKGWYMYEIAGAVALIEHRSDLDEIVNEVISGYEMVKPILKEDKEEIRTFIMMRRIGMLQSLICRIGSVFGGNGETAELTPEILAFYAKGTVLLAKDYLKEYKEKPMPTQKFYSEAQAV